MDKSGPGMWCNERLPARSQARPIWQALSQASGPQGCPAGPPLLGRAESHRTDIGGP